MVRSGKKIQARVSEERLHALLKKLQQTNSAEETFQRAEAMGKQLKPGTAVALTGEIGSGKTVFIKGLCRGLGVKNPDEVKSPTFVLLHLYKGRVLIYHFDLYRLERESELDAIGFDEFVSNPKAVSLIEWADRAPGRIPKDSLRVHIEITGPSSRLIRLHENHSRP